ncbi:hypothetical protein BIU82_17555 [Arthrobacter sp. SW1]|uniref:hypothetical protein n=1 Tax=Arthrobacter sp. SW1 TaxID=1920889 RepID=UPI000877DBCA|nr:hypothetical protein [Arthrobacter sp. SW1]OFI38755.1 hypothetical protein BIU82_17555 [Arthrobacter sp. SW1]
MSTTLASPKRLAIAAVPVLGIVFTPLLPFVHTPTFWLGLPAAVVWMTAMVILTVVALQIVERSYLREGGAELDRLEGERDAIRRAQQDATAGEGH